MGLFTKKKLEDKLSYKIEMANKIVSHQIKYITERVDNGTPSGKAVVICHAGRANIKDDCLLINSNDNDIFKCEIKNLKASELFSTEGCIIEGPDLFHEGKTRTIIVYYTYYL